VSDSLQILRGGLNLANPFCILDADLLNRIHRGRHLVETD
jgi:hypothetical protein